MKVFFVKSNEFPSLRMKKLFRRMCYGFINFSSDFFVSSWFSLQSECSPLFDFRPLLFWKTVKWKPWLETVFSMLEWSLFRYFLIKLSKEVMFFFDCTHKFIYIISQRFSSNNRWNKLVDSINNLSQHNNKYLGGLMIPWPSILILWNPDIHQMIKNLFQPSSSLGASTNLI